MWRKTKPERNGQRASSQKKNLIDYANWIQCLDVELLSWNFVQDKSTEASKWWSKAAKKKINEKNCKMGHDESKFNVIGFGSLACAQKWVKTRVNHPRELIVLPFPSVRQLVIFVQCQHASGMRPQLKEKKKTQEEFKFGFDARVQIIIYASHTRKWRCGFVFGGTNRGMKITNTWPPTEHRIFLFIFFSVRSKLYIRFFMTVKL